MYDSPIRIILNDIQTAVENEVYSAVQRVGIDVDRDKLLQALNNDRKRYEEAYKKGWNDSRMHLYEMLDEKGDDLNDG